MPLECRASQRMLSSVLYAAVTLLFISCSVHDEGTGLLFDSMETLAILRSTGEVSWLAPLVLQSACLIDISQFPFDNQTCPLMFGLWSKTFSDVERTNLSLTRSHGDLSEYKKNGIFLLDGMPAQTVVRYYECCPGVPYNRLIYKIHLTRRTKFYLLDFFFPAVVLLVVLFVCFLMPPESGERISLVISIVLGLMLHMFHVYDHIPHTSDAIPVIAQFLTATTAVSAITLFTSAVAVKWSHCTNGDVRAIPWLIKVLVNKHIAWVVFAKRRTKSPVEKSQGVEELTDGNMKATPSPTEKRTRLSLERKLRAKSPTDLESSNDNDIWKITSKELTSVKTTTQVTEEEFNSFSSETAVDNDLKSMDSDSDTDSIAEMVSGDKLTFEYVTRGVLATPAGVLATPANDLEDLAKRSTAYRRFQELKVEVGEFREARKVMKHRKSIEVKESIEISDMMASKKLLNVGNASEIEESKAMEESASSPFQAIDKGKPLIQEISADVNVVTKKIEEKEAAEEYFEEWRHAVLVFDRFSGIILALVTFIAGLYMCLSVPKIYVS